jgi:hypothetical protein
LEQVTALALYIMAWLSFILAAIGAIIGVVLLEVSLPTQGFFAMGYVFTISSCFTLAKVIRDKREAEKLISKIEKAKTKKLITKYTNMAWNKSNSLVGNNKRAKVLKT